jgi:hypothetical protein
MAQVERHHWLNTFLGILDAAFHLTDEEQAHVIVVLRDLLAAVRVPDRGEPVELPAALALEVTSNFFTVSLAGPRDNRTERPVRFADRTDLVVSLEAWRDALMGMLLVAYPDLLPVEKLLLSKYFTELLTGIGVPARAPEFLPSEVVNAHRRLPESQTW